MRWLFQAFLDRLQALFISVLAADFETQAVSLEAERKAELLRQAEAFRRDGLDDLADELIQQAQRITLAEPLSKSLSAVEGWRDAKTTEVPALPASREKLVANKSLSPSRVKRKAKRKTR
ncbi:MAG: hypothetical protein N2C14_02690 [Planctomycetales bacterium]